MNDKEIGWVAGLLEGEGSFYYESGYRIKCEMTDRDVLEKLQAICGGGTITDREARRSHWKPTYDFGIYGESAIHIMEAIRDLMGTRRQAQIDSALSKWYDVQKANEAKEYRYLAAMRERKETNASFRQLAVKYDIDRQMLSKRFDLV